MLQSHTITTLRRIQDFMDANTATLRAVAPGTNRAELDAATAPLTAVGIQQTLSQSVGETKGQKTLLKTLVQGHVEPIARAAKGPHR